MMVKKHNKQVYQRDKITAGFSDLNQFEQKMPIGTNNLDVETYKVQVKKVEIQKTNMFQSS